MPKAVNKVVIGNETLVDLTGDTVASAADIVNGKVGHLRDGTQVTGTATGSIPSGWHDTSGVDATADDVREGKFFVAADGTLVEGTIPTATANVSITNKNSKIIPAGIYDGVLYARISSAQRALIVAENIKSGVTMLGVTGTYEGISGLDSFANRASGDLTSSSALGSFSFSVGFEPKIFIMFHNGGISKPSSGTTIIAMAKIADANRGNYGWGATLNSSGNTYHLYERASSTSYKAGLNFTSTGVSGWEDSSYALNFSGKYRYVAYG